MEVKLDRAPAQEMEVKLDRAPAQDMEVKLGQSAQEKEQGLYSADYLCDCKNLCVFSSVIVRIYIA